MSEDSANKRRAMLQALRKRDEAAVVPGESNTSKEGSAQNRIMDMLSAHARAERGTRSERGAGPMGGGGGAGGALREGLLKKLQERRGQGGGGGFGGGLAGKLGGGGLAGKLGGGAGLGKGGLGQRMQKPGPDASLEEISKYRQDLETKVNRLEKLLPFLRNQLEEARQREDAASK